MSDPIALEEAWERLFAAIEPLPAETVAVDESAARVLAEPVVARRTQPAADLSAMDGFACSGDGPWQVVGESRAGAWFEAAIEPGQAVRISTGAALPRGTDRILVIEEARLEGELLSAAREPLPGRYVRPRGFDFAQGDSLLESGTRIGPAALALARAAGHSALSVHRVPSVAILECGDELVADPENCPDDCLPASNGAMLAAMATGEGARVGRFGPIPDRRSAVRDALESAREHDLIITSGGASVGEHDLVLPALEALGADIGFWRVAIRPGKPLLVARFDGALVLGLPGNPVSSFVTGFLFMLPAIRALAGDGRPLPVALPIPVAEDLPPGGPRREFLRARLVGGRAQPLAERDSSALHALASADLLIDRPVHASETKAGTPVHCYCLGNGGNA